MSFKGFVIREEDPEHRKATNFPAPLGGNAFIRLPDADHENEPMQPHRSTDEHHQPLYPFRTAKHLMTICHQNELSISDVVFVNECGWRSPDKVRDGILKIWNVMDNCIEKGCTSKETYLPGKIQSRRRAPRLYRQLLDPIRSRDSVSRKIDWLSCFAIAVNEENAAGGRVVTAPTNGGSDTLCT